jgi:hypothetical protein
VDEQQVNLTRFPVVFPEKRDFFLEGRGTFEFGRSSGQAGFNGQVNTVNQAPQLFFTRRIGLDNGREVSIIAGGRVTGTVGNSAVGVMNMETGFESPGGVPQNLCAPPYVTCTPRTNFTVARVRQDILRRPTIGAIFTNRSNSPTVDGANQAYGVDVNFSFFQNVTANGYYARSQSVNRSGDEDSFQAASTTRAIATGCGSTTSTSAPTTTRKSGSSSGAASGARSPRRGSARACAPARWSAATCSSSHRNT